MGFLHDGHLSLIRESKKLVTYDCFHLWNPTSWSSEDFNKISRDVDREISFWKMKQSIIFFFLQQRNLSEKFSDVCQCWICIKETRKAISSDTFRGVSTIVLICSIVFSPIMLSLTKGCTAISCDKSDGEGLKLDVKIIGCPIVRERMDSQWVQECLSITFRKKESACPLSFAWTAKKYFFGRKKVSWFIDMKSCFPKFHQLILIT